VESEYFSYDESPDIDLSSPVATFTNSVSSAKQNRNPPKEGPLSPWAGSLLGTTRLVSKSVHLSIIQDKFIIEVPSVGMDLRGASLCVYFLDYWMRTNKVDVLQLVMTCGTENVINSVQELEKCEYQFTGTTPALCLPVDAESGNTGSREEL
jgi:hypothetical protein